MSRYLDLCGGCSEENITSTMQHMLPFNLFPELVLSTKTSPKQWIWLTLPHPLTHAELPSKPGGITATRCFSDAGLVGIAHGCLCRNVRINAHRGVSKQGYSQITVSLWKAVWLQGDRLVLLNHVPSRN